MPSISRPTPPVGGNLLVARPAAQTARLVQFSCQRLLGVEPDFAASFHDALCGLAPTLHGLPPPDGRRLSAALAHCVLWAALTQDPADVVEATVRDFAAAHHGRGFPYEAYGGLGHALLRSVRETLPGGWSSELSSGWVSYVLWLQPYLESGARAAGDGRRATGGSALSLRVVHDALAVRYFPGQQRALDAVCTRVMLRTGADLRDPRPDQDGDPALVAEVLQSLLLMGYAPVPGVSVAFGQAADGAVRGPVGGGAAMPGAAPMTTSGVAGVPGVPGPAPAGVPGVGVSGVPGAGPAGVPGVAAAGQRRRAWWKRRRAD